MNFNCYEKEELNLGETRYDSLKEDPNVIGVGYWQGGRHDGYIVDEWDHGNRVAERSKLTKPRVFISHRQLDSQRALDFANYLTANGIEYWLDLCDSRLVNAQNLTPIAIANIIEIALINCTHVVAIMTKNSKGSLWIPYEYGRIKDPSSYIGNVCAYYDIPKTELPEYMMLSEYQTAENKVVQWINTSSY